VAFANILARKLINRSARFAQASATQYGRGIFFERVSRPTIIRPSLEKRVGQEWLLAWSPVRLLCLSPPVVIHEGALYRDSLQIAGGRFGSDVHPQFSFEDVEGVYRLFWDPAGRGVGSGGFEALPDDQRISNAFVLKEL